MDVALVQYINRLCRHLAITPARLHPHEVYLDPADATDPRMACLASMCPLRVPPHTHIPCCRNTYAYPCASTVEEALKLAALVSGLCLMLIKTKSRWDNRLRVDRHLPACLLWSGHCEVRGQISDLH